MEQLVKQLSSLEKELVDNPAADENAEQSDNESLEQSGVSSFQKIDGKFKKIYEKLSEKMWAAQQSGDPAITIQLQQYMSGNRTLWEKATDHNGTSILHHAVQNGNCGLVKTLLNAGVNPNVKERCGATPLTIAVLKGDEEMVKILQENFAICHERFFHSVPSPKAIAEKLNLDKIVTLIEMHLDLEDEQDVSVWKMIEVLSYVQVLPTEELSSHEPDTKYRRDMINCKTLVVGDQGSNKIIRSVKNKSPSAYEWVAEVPGDMHARGTVNIPIVTLLSPCTVIELNIERNYNRYSEYQCMQNTCVNNDISKSFLDTLIETGNLAEL